MCFFPNEGDEVRSLVLIPLVIRRRLDECGARLSLAQWQALPMPLRRALALMASGDDDPITFREALSWMVEATAPPGAPPEARMLEHRPAETPWRDPAAHAGLAAALESLGFPPSGWLSLDLDTRFALVHAFRGQNKHPGDLETLVRTLGLEKS